jgi:hypothetical protein
MSTEALNQLNGDIVMDLQERGVAAPSTTKLHGLLAIRVNITNHRTTFADIDLLIDAVVAAGRTQGAAWGALSTSIDEADGVRFD